MRPRRDAARDRTRRRTAPRPLALALGLLLVVASATAGYALFSGLASASNTAASASCFPRASVHTGTTTSTATGTVTVTLPAAITTSKSFLFFSTRSNLNRPVVAEIAGRIASSTTLEFNRVTDEASTVNITWNVVEYDCGVTVQRGSTAQSGATTNVTITAVPALSQAFVTWSKSGVAADQAFADDDFVLGDLTSTTNVQFRANTANASHTIWWQVVSFDDSSKINVQRGTTSMTGATTSTTATISAVTTSRSFVLVNTRAQGGTDIASGMVRARLTSSTQVTLDRSAANFDVTEIAWQVVELKDGSAVQSGSTTLGSATASATPSLTAVDLQRATAFASTQEDGGQNAGRTSYTTDDLLGVAEITLDLTSATQLTITRNNTAAGSDFAWFVVEWGVGRSCYSRASVRTGTTTSTGNGTTTVTLSPAVTTSKSFLFFSTRSNLNRPVVAEIAGRIASSTTLEFNRATDESSTVNITWNVVEYNCGVTVQRGSTPQSGTSTNVTITAVPALAQAFVTWSKFGVAADATFADDDFLLGDLTSTTNVQFRANTLNAAHTIWWQVVSFDDSSKIGVQRGTTSLTGGATSATATISAVTTSRSFVLAGMRSPGNGTEIGSGMVRARLTSSTQVTLDRSAANYDVTEIAWQVVELKDGSGVQSGSATLASATASTTASLTAVDLTRASAFASTQSDGGQNAGRTTYAGDDLIGVATATLDLTSSIQLTLTRNNTVAAADISWFVVEWGNP